MKRFVALWREAYCSPAGKQTKFSSVERLERSADFQIGIGIRALGNTPGRRPALRLRNHFVAAFAA